MSPHSIRRASAIIFISQLKTDELIFPLFYPLRRVPFWHSTIVVEIQIPIFIIARLTPREDQKHNKKNGQQSFHPVSIAEEWRDGGVWG